MPAMDPSASLAGLNQGSDIIHHPSIHLLNKTLLKVPSTSLRVGNSGVIKTRKACFCSYAAYIWWREKYNKCIDSLSVPTCEVKEVLWRSDKGEKGSQLHKIWRSGFQPEEVTRAEVGVNWVGPTDGG